MIQETQVHNSSNRTSQDQEMKPLIKYEWNGHDKQHNKHQENKNLQ
jgi:hypothetical protein